MPSDRRLHPLSILFNVAKRFGAIAVPLLFVMIGRGSDEDRWSIYALLFLVPYAAVVVGGYLSFRYRYEDSELVIRRGIFFRNQRHIPYARIQNIDAVQNLFHRLAGVIEVRIQTGGGSEPEATLSVLTPADLAEMRDRVFQGRRLVTDVAAADTETPAVPVSAELLHLPARELTFYGLIENHGMIVIGAALGLLWEFLPPALLERWIGEHASQGFIRSTMRALVDGDGLTRSTIAIAALGLVVFLIFSRVFSVAWAIVRLNGYRLTRSGDDLRAEYGLLTRVVATVPRRRIQTITIRQSLLHRLCGRAAVRVATAGGKDERQQRGADQREWLAPIISAAAVPALIAELLPGVDTANLPWRPVHARAVRRAFVRRLFGAAMLGMLAFLVLGPMGLWLWPLLILRAAIFAKLYVRHLAWAISGDVVAFREGIFGRITTIAPLVRIQVVEMLESPFDRRTVMARVRVDTAGGSSGHGVDVPYLPADVARSLYGTLSGAAAHTAFQW